ncbi:MAG: DUF58 domain-containing protein [Candidatus Accumulibacter sp.]|jgi:uncharacterized protein (DUF58 family)|nr:DUF58 domain-containing protein [Accumulibacter sp.]
MRLRVTQKLVPLSLCLPLSLLPALLVNSVSGYLPFLALLCGVLLSLAHLLLIKNRVAFSADAASGRRVRGDSAGFTVSVRNGASLPVPGLRAELYFSTLDGHDCQALPLYVTLSPRQSRDFTFAADFTHIGAYRVGIRRLAIYDLFGLFYASRPALDIGHIDILPRLHTLRSLPVSSALQADSSRAVTAVQLSGTDYTGVREYAFGDPIKMVHWKLSAHALGLMTKQTESYTNAGLSVVLDFHIPDYDADARLGVFDAIVEAGAAIGDYAARSGMDYDLRYLSGNGERRRTTPASFRELDGAVRQMRVFSMDEHAALTARMLNEDCAATYALANIALCAAFLTEELILALLNLRRFGKHPILCLIVPTGLDPKTRAETLEPLKKLQYASIPCLVASTASEL